MHRKKRGVVTLRPPSSLQEAEAFLKAQGQPLWVDVISGQLWLGEQSTPLRPKVLSVLQYLQMRVGQIVPAAELLVSLWPGIVVNRGTLNNCILELRAVLGDRRVAPKFIETVPQRGYRLLRPIPTVPPHSRSLHLSGTTLGTSSVSQSSSSAYHLVGRDQTLGQLRNWFTRTQEGRRQLVLVTGEPGIGKTAVIEAFLRQIAPAPDVWIAYGQCLEHQGTGEAYLPVLEALGRLGRHPEHERLIRVLRQYAPTWLVQLPALVSVAERKRLQQELVGATQARMLREFCDALDILTGAAIARGPASLVLVLEDLQWSDIATVDLFFAIMERQEPARLLVIGTCRSEAVLTPGHPVRTMLQELQSRGHCQELVLAPLPEAAVAQYLAVRLPGNQTTANLAHVIYTRTDGNPLFVHNLVDHLLSQGLLQPKHGVWELTVGEAQVGVPTNIQQMIKKQLELLSAQEARLLAVASVAGMEFSVATVAAILQEQLETMERVCHKMAQTQLFLRLKETSKHLERRRATRYEFSHALYREVVYAEISTWQRVQLHRQIGEWKETTYGQRAAMNAAELAEHFEQGQEYRKAIQYRERAAATTLPHFAHQEAVHHLTKALTLCLTLPDSPERSQQEVALRVALAPSLIARKGWAAPELEQNYARVRVLCQQNGDSPYLFPALFGLWICSYARADLPTALELAKQLLFFAHNHQDQSFLTEAQHALGNTLFRQGQLREARSHLEEGTSLYDPHQHRLHALLYGLDGGVAGLGYTAWVLWFLGYPEQAVQKTQEMLSLVQTLSHPLSLAWALNSAAWHHIFRREAQAAQEQIEKAMALCTEYGFMYLLHVGMIVQGWASVIQEQSVSGLARIEQGLAALQAMDARIGRSLYIATLVEGYEKVGRTSLGLHLLSEAISEARQTGACFYEAELYRLKGELTLQSKVRSRRSVAEKDFQQAIAIARRQGARLLELRAVLSLSRLWQWQDKAQEAHQMLSEVYGWFTEGFDTKDLQAARALLAGEHQKVRDERVGV